MTTEDKVISFVRENALFEHCTGCVLGVSGGPDSMAMLALTVRNRGAFPFPLAVAHVNHKLRPEADAEEEAVEEYCRRSGIPFYVLTLHIPDGVSVETYAREARHAYFEEIRRSLGFSHIATAHTADDNVETFFMRVCRGGGTEGLQGIRPLRDGHIAHPMLCLEKAEILAFCDKNAIPYAIDKTNAENVCTRNVFRNEILPRLKEINPSLNDAVLRAQEALGEDAAHLNREAGIVILRARASDGSLSLSTLKLLDNALLGRVLSRSFASVCPTALTYTHIRALYKLIRKQPALSFVALPGGYYARKTETALVFTQTLDAPATFTPFVLAEGDFDLGNAVLHVSRTSSGAHLDDTGVCLIVRPRITGDTLCRYRKSGTKTLKKLFIEKKIPREEREAIPVIADENGVLYVVGFGADVRAKTGGSGFLFVLEKK